MGSQADKKSAGIGKGAPGPGRPKGKPNKATAAAREAIAKFVDGNADRLQGWLDDIAADPKLGPAAAFDRFMNVVEYHIPKLARTTVAGDPENPVHVKRSASEYTDDELAAIIAAGKRA